MDEPFTRNTCAEVDFLVNVMELELGASVLDVGCGTGRHSIELARRGYKVTGVDMSSTDAPGSSSITSTRKSTSARVLRVKDSFM